MNKNNFDKNVKILGQEYNINFDLDDTENDGLTFVYEKNISITPANKLLEKNSSFESKEAAFKEVLRHELLHAFFFEGGCPDYCFDENLVNFLAIQTPKIFDVFSELNIIK